MNIKTSNTNWTVNGIKYAIFKRISVGLTHDLVGPLSVALIQAGIIKRKLKADTYQASELLENAINIESYIKQTIVLIRAQKSWDAPNEDIFDAENVYKQCIKFFQTRLAMKGIDLLLLENNPQYAINDRFEAFLYCWLALLYYFEDTLEALTAVHVEQVEPREILILLKQKQSDPIDTGDAKSFVKDGSDELIGQQELLTLSQHYQTTIEFKADSISFKW